ncbi:hypothetical protein CDL31_22630 [Enterobacter kobei]|nr:hypothetical protein CDL31_22630 [Enterobacter kobei]
MCERCKHHRVCRQEIPAHSARSGVVSENGIYGHSRFCNTDLVRLENGIYGHSRFCNTDFDDKLACLNLSGV